MKNFLIFLIFTIGCSFEKQDLEIDIYQEKDLIIFEVENKTKRNFFLTMGHFEISPCKKKLIGNTFNEQSILFNDLEYLELVSTKGNQDLNLKKILLKKYSDCEALEGFNSIFDFYENLDIEKVSNNRFLLSQSNSIVKYIYKAKNLKKNIDYCIKYKNLEFDSNGTIGKKRQKALNSFYNIEKINDYYSNKKQIKIKPLKLKHF